MKKEDISKLVAAGMTHCIPDPDINDSQLEEYITNPATRKVYTDVTAPQPVWPDATKISDSTGTQEPG